MDFRLARGGSVTYAAFGSGAPLLCLHFAGRESPALHSLATSRRVLTPELSGAQAADMNALAEFVAALAGGCCDVMARAEGCDLALALAVGHPDRVKRLVLQSPAPLSDSVTARLPEIGAETLILLGTNEASDAAATRESVHVAGPVLKARMAKAHLTWVHDSGADIDRDQPMRMARLVDRFLDLGPAFKVRQAGR